MRRLTLNREVLVDLTPAELGRIAFGATDPSCLGFICLAGPSGNGCETILVPCYQSSQCSHPC